jgi:hypothetical protein
MFTFCIVAAHEELFTVQAFFKAFTLDVCSAVNHFVQPASPCVAKICARWMCYYQIPFANVVGFTIHGAELPPRLKHLAHHSVCATQDDRPKVLECLLNMLHVLIF